MTHLLVVANETVDAATLREALRARGDDLHVTVVSPVNEPRRGYVVYTDTRRGIPTRPTQCIGKKVRLSAMKVPQKWSRPSVSLYIRPVIFGNQ